MTGVYSYTLGSRPLPPSLVLTQLLALLPVVS